MKNKNILDLNDFTTRESRLGKVGHKISDYSIEIISVIGLILIAYMIGLFMQNVGHGVQAFSDLLDEHQVVQEDLYQTKQVLNALVLQRQEESNVHEVTGAELPPYWKAPVESN